MSDAASQSSGEPAGGSRAPGSQESFSGNLEGQSPAGPPAGPSGGTSYGAPTPHGELDRVAAPRRIGRRDPSKITFEWSDGVKNEASAAEIRRGCPCAHCVDEHTGRAILDPASVPDGLTQTSVSLVGNYALSIVFSDGHRTGIYTWARLRALAEA